MGSVYHFSEYNMDFLPDYPYEACEAVVELTEPTEGPVLYGAETATSNEPFTLKWVFIWPSGLGATTDGFELWESTTGPDDSDFTNKIHWTNNQTMADHRELVMYELTRQSGSYWYRVIAQSYGLGGMSEYNNAVKVAVTD